MDDQQLIDICHQLATNEAKGDNLSPMKLSSYNGGYITPVVKQPVVNLTLETQDITALKDFVQIWTDVLKICDVEQLRKQDVDNLSQAQFEMQHNLIHLGFFYVHVNPLCPAIEFLNLLRPLKLEYLSLPGTNQVSYSTLGQYLDSDRIALQLMVLGDYFQFWKLINPYQQMKHSASITRLILVSMGNCTIQLIPNYLTLCSQLIDKSTKIFSI